MFTSNPEFVAAEVDYRRHQVRAAWRTTARATRRIRVVRGGGPQSRHGVAGS